MNILLADDDPQVRDLIAAMLSVSPHEKHNISHAVDGGDGCRQFIAGDGKFDLIVSDFQMPRISGASFLRQVRIVQGSEVPFIMVTSDTDRARKTITEIMPGSLGKFALLEKPISMDGLQDTINELDCVPEFEKAMKLINRAHGMLDVLFADLLKVSMNPGKKFPSLPSDGEEWPVLVDMGNFLTKHGMRKEDEKNESERARRKVQDATTG